MAHPALTTLEFQIMDTLRTKGRRSIREPQEALPERGRTPTRRLGGRGTILLFAAAITALAAPTLGGMQSPPPQFDAVSIKPSHEIGGFIKLPAINGSEWRADNATADTFIAYAYDSARGAATAFDPRIINAPKWLATARYDVAAKIPSGVRVEQVPLMVESMLADRFQLKMHREVRELRAFSLSVAPSGSKLTANEECSQPDAPRLSIDGLLCGTIANQRDVTGPNVIVARGVTAQQIADWAFGNENSEKSVPVADRTGLKGLYDFKLKWTPEDSRGHNGGLSSQQVSEDNRALLAQAVKDQLGLLLNLAHASRQPVQVWVIDNIAMPGPD